MGTIEKAVAGRAGSGKNNWGGHPPQLFLTDPARPATALSIVPTDREPGTG